MTGQADPANSPTSDPAADAVGRIAHHSLEIPGGSLYYRTEGTGPLLLLLGGGASNADTLGALAGHLPG
jgi:hypothetical protein